MKFGIAVMHTPVGRITLAAGPRGLCALEFDLDPEQTRRRLAQRFGEDVEIDPGFPLDRAREALIAYFRGDIRTIDSLPVDPGGTPFQRRVWARLRRIPSGRTKSYGELAKALGIPGGARAVGLANGSNPVAIVIPCHRVIAADGTLGGYGGGLDRKRWLLAHEGARVRGLAESGSLLL